MRAEAFANVCSTFQCLLSVAQEGRGGDGGLESVGVGVGETTSISRGG